MYGKREGDVICTHLACLSLFFVSLQLAGTQKVYLSAHMYALSFFIFLCFPTHRHAHIRLSSCSWHIVKDDYMDAR